MLPSLVASPATAARGAAELENSGAQIAKGSASHMFRNATGHFAEDTVENRALIQNAVRPDCLICTNSSGVSLYRDTLSPNEQIWAKVFGGEITNGGINLGPRVIP
jgi:hypothetical protein